MKSATLNNRLYVAFILFCASPFAFTSHLFFDNEVKYEWMGFIENWFHLLNLIGPYLFFLVVLAGVCLLIPPKQASFKVFRYTLKTQLMRMLAIPIGICIAKIIWLSAISSNEDFWAIPNWTIFAVGLSCGYVFYRSIEYFTWRKYHAYDGLVCTLEGAAKAFLPPGIKERLEPIIEDLKQFNLKY